MEKNYSQTYVDIKYVKLKSFSGKTEDITHMFIELDTMEDLFSNIITGFLTIIDSDNFYDEFPIIGEELLTIRYTDFFDRDVTRTFFVYKIESKQQGSDRTMIYKLNICSEEYFYSLDNPYSKSYKDKLTHTIVSDAAGKMNLTKPLNIQPTIEFQDYAVTRKTPLDVCIAMCHRAISEQGHEGSYLFYEDLFKFNFVSIEKLIQSAPTTYYIGDANMFAKQDKWKIVRSYNFSETVDHEFAKHSGFHGMQVKSLDLLKRKLDDESYNYFDDGDYASIQRINSGNPMLRLTSKDFKHKTNKNLRKLVIKATDDNYKSSKPRILGKRYNVLSSYTYGPKVNIEVPFHAHMTIGGMIDLEFYDKPFREVLPNPNREKYLSGKYLITKCRQKIKPDYATTALELSKDSYRASHEAHDTYVPKGRETHER